MRRRFAVLLLVVTAGVFAQDASLPEALLQRGVASYKAGDASSAVTDLEAAERGFGPGPETLPSLETALVYLALAQFRLGREEDARETLLRLHAAERLAPTYATLPLGTDAAEIEALAAALLPTQPLPRNGELSADESARPLPLIVPKKEAVRKAESRSATASHEAFSTLRAAEAAAENGALGEAVNLYSRLARATDVPREVLIEAAIGLHRTGAYRDAVEAFPRLGPFARGEEDLRYYYAVSLYESGQYAEARKQMACALPFIRETDEVLRYRDKIARTLARK